MHTEMLEAARAALAAHRAQPQLATWRLLDVLKVAQEHDPRRDQPEDLDLFVRLALDRHLREAELEDLLRRCKRHQGPGLRRVRTLKSQVAALLKRGISSAEDVRKLKREYRAATQRGSR